MLLGVISLALASDVPPETLPKGFLEQLPLLESFQDAEFEYFLQFVEQQITQNSPEVSHKVDQFLMEEE